MALRGREAALAGLREKQQAAAGGAGVLSPPYGGAPAFGAASSSSTAPGAGDAFSMPARAGAGIERSTFAERVGDVKDGVDKAREKWEKHRDGALGAGGTAAGAGGLHQKFAHLQAQWGGVMDMTGIDAFSGGPRNVNAASASLSRNKRDLDQQADLIIADLWDGVTSGQNRSMTDERKDAMMQQILQAPGGMPLSPTKRQEPGGYAPHGGGGRDDFALAVQVPYPEAGQMEMYAAPPAGAQDFETRRQLEILRGEMLRLEEQVLQAVEAEEQELPPPPPLVEKHRAGLRSLNRAAEYEDIYRRIKSSVVGCEADSGGTPCNSVDDPSVPLMMPPRGGMKIRQQIEALQKETQELKEAAVQEIGGEAAARRMREMQSTVDNNRRRF